MKIEISHEEAEIILNALLAYKTKMMMHVIPDNIKVMKEEGCTDEEIDEYCHKMKKWQDKRTSISNRMYYEVYIPERKKLKV